MQRYFGIAQDRYGNVIPNASITVYKASTLNAGTLYSDNNYSSLVNPFTSDNDGTYEFYAQNGRYDIVLTKTGVTFDDASTADLVLFDPSTSLSPPQILADQNNYAPTNGLNAAIWRLTSDAARTITGITAGFAGQTLTIINVGSFAITLSDQSGSSSSSNQIITGSGADVVLNAAGVASLIYDLTSTKWRITSVVAGSVASVFVMSPGSIAGLSMSNNTGDATNDIDVTVGAASSDDAILGNRTAISLVTALTKQLDVNWTAGTNQGMLDTGAVGNNTYHIFAILNTSTGAVDILASLSATSPTMPSGYNRKRRIGSVIRSGGANLAFKQDGDIFQLKDPILDVNANNPGTSAVTRTLTVPTGISVLATVNAMFTNGASATQLYLSDLGVTDAAPSSTVAPLATIMSGAASNSWAGGILRVRTNTSSQIRSRLNASDASTNVRIATLGWVDRRDGDM